MATATQSSTMSRREYVEPKETKTFSKTSEFWVWLATVAAVLAAVLMIDGFGPDRGWTLVTALSVGYMISRGLAKAGARKSDTEGYSSSVNRDGYDSAAIR
jgi:hypothetical protein